MIMIRTVCKKWKTNCEKFQGLNLFLWFRINYFRNWECFDQSCENRTESVHRTLRFLFSSHLLYRICVKVFIMNWYISKSYTTTKNGFGRQYTEQRQLYSGMLKHGSPHDLHNLAKWHLKRIVLISHYETWQTVWARGLSKMWHIYCWNISHVTCKLSLTFKVFKLKRGKGNERVANTLRHQCFSHVLDIIN